MEITVLIPTRGDRVEGISNAVDSIDIPVETKVLYNTTGWLKAVNAACGEIEEGAMLLSADDMIYHPGAIQAAIDAMNERFPDGDGVIGFNQVTLEDFCKGGFTLVGQKFMQRFPNKAMFCPDLKHYYADTEFLAYAEMEEKFFYCEDAKVDHYHFSVTKEQDATTKISRVSYLEDKATHEKRRDRGFLWGSNFNLLNKEGQHES